MFRFAIGCSKVLRSRQSLVSWRGLSGYTAAGPIRRRALLAGIGAAILTGVAWTKYNTRANCSTKVSERVEAGVARSGLPDYKLNEVAKHKSADTGVWVTYKDGVYDITEFMDVHPGGSEKIVLAAGASIEPYWEVFAAHNTDEVKEMLEELRIGNVHPSDRGKSQGEKAEGPYANDPKRSPVFKVNTQTPFNAETPIVLLTDSYITPNSLFFVRNHLPVPVVDPNKYVLEVKGQGQEPVYLTLDDLRTKFKQYTITATIQCAGNRRSELADIKPVKGLNWTGGALGNAKVSRVLTFDL